MFSRDVPKTNSKTWKLTFSSRYTVPASWVPAGSDYDLQETQSLALYEECLNKSLRMMTIVRQSMMCTFSEHVCLHVLWGHSILKYSVHVQSHSSSSENSSWKSMDSARLIEEPSHKDIFASWVICSRFLCSLSVPLQYPLEKHLRVSEANTAFRGRKILWWCTLGSTATSSCQAVADHGDRHLEASHRSDHHLL